MSQFQSGDAVCQVHRITSDDGSLTVSPTNGRGCVDLSVASSPSQNVFDRISLPDGSLLIADTTNDTVYFSSTDLNITGNSASDTISFSIVESALDISTHANLLGLTSDDHTQYHTDSRALTWLGTRSTDDLPEGSNLYFTDERAQDAIGNALSNSSTINLTYDDLFDSITASIIQTSIDHGSIGGLSDDDHTQYLNTTRHSAITGNPHATNFLDLSDVVIAALNSGDMFYSNSTGDVIDLARPIGLGTYQLTCTNAGFPKWTLSSSPAIPTWASVLFSGNTSGGSDAVISNAQSLQFRDSSVDFSSPSTGNLDVLGAGTLTLTWTTLVNIVNAFKANAGMQVSLPGVGSSVAGFYVDTASTPGVYFVRTATSAGNIVFSSSSTIYHQFGTLSAGLIGDVSHTDGTNTMSFDASAAQLSVTDGTNTLRLDAANNRFEIGANNGASGTFTTTDGKTVTVVGGIITSIV